MLSTALQSSWSEGGTTRHNFGRGSSNDYFIKVWFQLSNWEPVAQLEPNLDGIVIGWSSSKIVSGRHSAIALLLKAALIQVRDYRLMGASSLLYYFHFNINRHNFGRGPSNDYFIKVWFQLSKWFQTRRFLCEFPIGSHVKLSLAVGAILVEGPKPPDTFLEGGWSFSTIVSGIRTLPPRWSPQCSCVVIESSFDPGERLEAHGSL
jgi:hypothetical protein